MWYVCHVVGCPSFLCGSCGEGHCKPHGHTAECLQHAEAHPPGIPLPDHPGCHPPGHQGRKGTQTPGILTISPFLFNLVRVCVQCVCVCVHKTKVACFSLAFKCFMGDSSAKCFVGDSSANQMKKILWVYCPGHAGVKGNDRADRLVGKATITGG